VPREYVKYPIKEFKEDYPDCFSNNVNLYVDVTDKGDYDKIKSVLKANRKKFHRILCVIFSGRYDIDLYGREGESVTAMKFKNDGNQRIYCKEMFSNGKKVIMIVSYKKKVQKNKDDKRILGIIERIKSYEYEIQE
jgi:hypothetical protein